MFVEFVEFVGFVGFEEFREFKESRSSGTHAGNLQTEEQDDLLEGFLVTRYTSFCRAS